VWQGGALAREVDWRASWLLNLVLQTTYRLTALVCNLESVDERLDGAGAAAELRGGAASREVHAGARSALAYKLDWQADL
jgi:hypothetical protein